jgi:hypothetical protein
MGTLLRAGKIAILLLIGIVTIYVAFIFASMGYASMFLSHKIFVDSFPFKETDPAPDGSIFNTSDSDIVNISDADFARYPPLRELVQEPARHRHITFDRTQFRDQQQIEDFRNKFISNRTINRYVRWNDTYYRIIIGQE